MTPDLTQALSNLPHGPEFRFVDELVSLEPGSEAVGLYRVRGDEAFLPGHFPGSPIMPGVILIEALAQLGGVVMHTDPEVEPASGLLLTAVRNAKILGAAAPGETLRITAKLTGKLGSLTQIEGSIVVAKDGRALLKASIALSAT